MSDNYKTTLDNGESNIADINEEILTYPPPPIKSKLKKNYSRLKHPSRKEKYNMLKEREMNEIVDNTIFLAPDWFCRKRKKKIIFGLQIDNSSALIGLIVGVLCTIYISLLINLLL